MGLCEVYRAKVVDTLYASIDTIREGMLSPNFINGIMPSKYFTSISKLYCINISFFSFEYIYCIELNNGPIRLPEQKHK